MTPSLKIIRQERDERRCRIARRVLALVIGFGLGVLANEIFTQINHVRVTWPDVMQ